MEIFFKLLEAICAPVAVQYCCVATKLNQMISIQSQDTYIVELR